MIIVYILLILAAAYGVYKFVDRYISAEKINQFEQKLDRAIYKTKRGKELIDKQRELRAVKRDLHHVADKSQLEDEIVKLERELEEMKGKKHGTT